MSFCICTLYQIQGSSCGGGGSSPTPPPVPAPAPGGSGCCIPENPNHSRAQACYDDTVQSACESRRWGCEWTTNCDGDGDGVWWRFIIYFIHYQLWFLIPPLGQWWLAICIHFWYSGLSKPNRMLLRCRYQQETLFELLWFAWWWCELLAVYYTMGMWLYDRLYVLFYSQRRDSLFL